jgi:hypothetical protein
MKQRFYARLWRSCRRSRCDAMKTRRKRKLKIDPRLTERICPPGPPKPKVSPRFRARLFAWLASQDLRAFAATKRARLLATRKFSHRLKRPSLCRTEQGQCARPGSGWRQHSARRARSTSSPARMWRAQWSCPRDALARIALSQAHELHPARRTA